MTFLDNFATNHSSSFAQVPNSSLTLWCHPGDPVTLEDLMLYRKAFGPSQLYYDLPEEFLNIFKLQVCKR